MSVREKASQLRLPYALSSGGRDRRSSDVPPSIRSSSTSRHAAARIAGISSKLGGRILDVLRDAGCLGLTDQELQELLCMTGDSERPRRVELVEEGLVVDSGSRRRTPGGRLAVVWIAVPIASMSEAS